MTRISKVLLSALAGAALLDIWIRAIVNFKSELMAALLFIPFLAVETTLLYLLNKAHSVTWNLASTAVAVGLAISGAVALIAPEMLFNWEGWKTVVIPVAWIDAG